MEQPLLEVGERRIGVLEQFQRIVVDEQHGTGLEGLDKETGWRLEEKRLHIAEEPVLGREEKNVGAVSVVHGIFAQQTSLHEKGVAARHALAQQEIAPLHHLTPAMAHQAVDGVGVKVYVRLEEFSQGVSVVVSFVHRVVLESMLTVQTYEKNYS